MSYEAFIERKTHLGGDHGFDPLWVPEFLFPFQRNLVEWALRKGRAALFEDCGLGKTVQYLVWAWNVHRHTGKPVLVLTPLAVSHQTVAEALKFGIDAARSLHGEIPAPIVVTNYERLHHFDSAKFGGVVCDESSCIKNFDAQRTGAITDFMRKLPLRLLCTATAAPNDYIELGTSSEALGNLGHMDMLARFFKNDQNSNHPNRLRAGSGKWRFRGHAERDFWRWICSWARAIRKPSDLGFSDDGFDLPPMVTEQHLVKAARPRPGRLFDSPAETLEEQREERRRTLPERCEKAAELVNSTGSPAVVWCHLNPEGDLLAKLIPDAVQVSGKDSDDAKEEAFEAFAAGKVRVMVSKPVIAGWGLNWQHCAHQTFFPSHSFEQWYQCTRRSWRYGQKSAVKVDIITTEGEAAVMGNLQRKADAAAEMFDRLVEHMSEELRIERANPFQTQQEIPSWL